MSEYDSDEIWDDYREERYHEDGNFDFDGQSPVEETRLEEPYVNLDDNIQPGRAYQIHNVFTNINDNMDGIIKTGKVDNQQRPGLSVDAARYLVLEKQVKMIAIDSLGIESRSSKNYEVNTWLCKHQILILEGLVNLQSITRQQVFLEAFPLKIKDVEGTPCRAIIKEAL